MKRKHRFWKTCHHLKKYIGISQKKIQKSENRKQKTKNKKQTN